VGAAPKVPAADPEDSSVVFGSLEPSSNGTTADAAATGPVERKEYFHFEQGQPPLELPVGSRRRRELMLADLSRTSCLCIDRASVHASVLKPLETVIDSTNVDKVKWQIVAALAHGFGSSEAVRRAAKRVYEFETFGNDSSSIATDAGAASADTSSRAKEAGGTVDVRREEAIRQLEVRLVAATDASLSGVPEQSVVQAAFAEARVAGVPKKVIARLHALHCIGAGDGSNQLSNPCTSPQSGGVQVCVPKSGVTYNGKKGSVPGNENKDPAY